MTDRLDEIAKAIERSHEDVKAMFEFLDEYFPESGPMRPWRDPRVNYNKHAGERG